VNRDLNKSMAEVVDYLEKLADECSENAKLYAQNGRHHRQAEQLAKKDAFEASAFLVKIVLNNEVNQEQEKK
jgi:hypothetical protein